MKRLFAAVGLLPLVVHAQSLSGLHSNHDGSALYFSSPMYAKADPSANLHDKIFRWDSSGARVRIAYQELERGESDGCTTGNFYQLRAPQASSDGETLLYLASRPVFTNRFCNPIPVQTVVRIGTRVWRFEGAGTLSPNGRYAITMPRAAIESSYHLLHDLTGNSSTLVAGSVRTDRPQQVTNDGATLSIEPRAVVIAERNGLVRVWPTEQAVDDAVIDASGRSIIYTTRLGPGAPGRMARIDVASGRETELAMGFAIQSPLISGDGNTVYFLEGTTRIYAVPIAGGGTQTPIATPSAGGLGAFTISGNGGFAFIANVYGARVRINLATGAETELLPPTPLVSTAYRILRPETRVAALGSVMILIGSGLDASKRITLCGRELRLEQSNPLRFTVPTDLPENRACNAIVETDSPWVHGLELQVKAYDPQYIRNDGGNAFLYSSDFRSINSQSSPARPGDVLVAYMTGLGDLKPGFGCRVEGQSADILFAGPAPGVPGFHQINVRLPRGLQAISVNLACGWEPDELTSTPVWLGPN